MLLPPLSDEEILATNIIGELGLEALPEERRVEIINKLTDLVQQRVMLHIAEKMSDTDAEELQKLMTEKGETDPAVMTFITEKIPGIPSVIRDELITVKKELIAHMNQTER